MIKIIKLTLIASIAVFLNSCWHEVEQVVKAEEVVLSGAPAKAVLLETDMMPSRSK
jgi:ribosome-associated protein YbcJ (S4-like RNA binding protein)